MAKNKGIDVINHQQTTGKKGFCKQCQKWSNIEVVVWSGQLHKLNWAILIIGLLLFVLPGLIYLVYHNSKNNNIPTYYQECCRFCHTKDFLTDVCSMNDDVSSKCIAQTSSDKKTKSSKEIEFDEI